MVHGVRYIILTTRVFLRKWHLVGVVMVVVMVVVLLLLLLLLLLMSICGKCWQAPPTSQHLALRSAT
jgi:hypothetical protein